MLGVCLTLIDNEDDTFKISSNLDKDLIMNMYKSIKENDVVQKRIYLLL